MIQGLRHSAVARHVSVKLVPLDTSPYSTAGTSQAVQLCQQALYAHLSAVEMPKRIVGMVSQANRCGSTGHVSGMVGAMDSPWWSWAGSRLHACG
eukprot:364326-Chlamydomonas_euryale.AAC.14